MVEHQYRETTEFFKKYNLNRLRDLLNIRNRLITRDYLFDSNIMEDPEFSQIERKFLEQIEIQIELIIKGIGRNEH